VELVIVAAESRALGFPTVTLMRRHPERSRSSGEAKDLARIAAAGKRCLQHNHATSSFDWLAPPR